MTWVRKLGLSLPFLCVCATMSAQEKPIPNWNAWQFLEGKWVGEGSSELGQGSGYFSFEPDLQKKIWVRRNHSEYPATKDRATYVHEDLMIVYFDQTARQTRAFYCDTEGHIIHYTVEFSGDGKKLVFLGERHENSPQYRLTYLMESPGHMSVLLEMAQPAKPDDFQKIVEGKVRRVAAS
jgi:hypothetical protein